MQGTTNAQSNNKSEVLTGTLTTVGWSNNAQTITVQGLDTSGYAYTVSPASASYSDYSECGIYANDITVQNSITFNCSYIPSNSISIVILKIKVA